MFRTAIKSMRLLQRSEGRRLSLLIVVALLASAVEAMAAGIVLQLLRMIGDADAPIVLPVIGDLRDRLGSLDTDTYVLVVLGGIGVFFLFRAALQIGASYMQNRIAQEAAASLSSRLAAGYLSMPYEFHLTRNSSTLVRNSHIASMQLVRQAFLPVIFMVSEVIVVIALLVVLFIAAPAAAAAAAGLVFLTAVVLLRVVNPRLKRAGSRAHVLNGTILRQLQEALAGIRDIKLLGREQTVSRDYRDTRYELAHHFWVNGLINEVPRTILESVFLLFVLGFFAMTLVDGRSAESTISVLGLFAYAGLRMQPSLHKIISGANSLRFAEAAVDDLAADLEQMRREAQHDRKPEGAFPFTDELRLDGVSFRYEGADRDALSNVSLTIRRGEWIGIVGPTGSGKTTLVDLVTGLLPPSSGRIQADGVDIGSDIRAWHANLGVVPQTVFLSDESLRRNIAFGVPEGAIDDDAVRAAAHMAQLDEMLAELPMGLDTIVGERGTKISGGQRQRVAIARTLYHRPPVLVLDEGTSSLDNTTERHLMKAIQDLRGERTILMVAHRLSTVERCDRVLVVDEGRIVAGGTYEELLRDNATFRALATGEDDAPGTDSTPHEAREPASVERAVDLDLLELEIGVIPGRANGAGPGDRAMRKESRGRSPGNGRPERRPRGRRSRKGTSTQGKKP